MTAWASPAQAARHWPTAANMDPALLSTLLEVATVACAAYAPPVELDAAAATVRTNAAVTTIGPDIANTTGLAGSGAGLSVGAGFVRGTLTTATATAMAQFVGTPAGAGPVSVPATPGVFYAAKLEARASTPGAAIMSQLLFYDAPGTGIASHAVAGGAAPVDAVNFTEIPPVVQVAPPNAAWLSVRWGLFGTTPRTIGDTIDARRLLIERGAKAPGRWFDGATTPDDPAHTAYAWTGAPALSASTETTTPDLVPPNYMLACIYQAREVHAAGARDSGDVIGFGDFAIRARELSTSVKALLRPSRGIGPVG